MVTFRLRFLSRRFKNFFSLYLARTFSSSISRARSRVWKDTILDAKDSSSSMDRSHRKLRWTSEILDGPCSSLAYSRHQEGNISVVEAMVALRLVYSLMIGSCRKFFGEYVGRGIPFHSLILAMGASDSESAVFVVAVVVVRKESTSFQEPSGWKIRCSGWKCHGARRKTEDRVKSSSFSSLLLFWFRTF